MENNNNIKVPISLSEVKIGSYLDATHQQELLRLSNEYRDSFALNISELRYTEFIKMDTKEDIFVYQTPVKKNNTKSAVRSVGYGELDSFEVVREKRNEAENLIRLNCTSVKNSPYAANRNRHCGQLFSKHHFMPRQRQNDESDGSQSQENVDDKQQLQPQRPVRRQLRHPYFRQYCSYLSIGLPRNVGRGGSEDGTK
ncbi:Y-box-binding protein 3-like [Stegodyphus dumicola]|uniref:Y-box-binding protein 3-like n=1 Tax=Stegodyphus dumicola TaxID=202533 RepID=UPI0015A9C4C4|nr:Y-box-binding protein 3-like [Stegodyphus dumicola]